MKLVDLSNSLPEAWHPSKRAQILRAIASDHFISKVFDDPAAVRKVLKPGFFDLDWIPVRIAGTIYDIPHEIVEDGGAVTLDVPDGLRLQAVELEGELRHKRSAPRDFKQAFLLALAWKEIRRTRGLWDFLVNSVVQSKNRNSLDQGWRTTLCLLYGLMSGSSEWVQTAFEHFDSHSASLWLAHVLVTNHVCSADFSQAALDALGNCPIEWQLSFLQALNRLGHAELSEVTARAFLGKTETWGGMQMVIDLDKLQTVDLSQRMTRLRQAAVLNQYAGCHAQSEICLKLAEEAARYWATRRSDSGEPQSSGNDENIQQIALFRDQEEREIHMAQRSSSLFRAPMPPGKEAEAGYERAEPASHLVEKNAESFIRQLSKPDFSTQEFLPASWHAGYLEALFEHESVDQVEKAGKAALDFAPADARLYALMDAVNFEKGRFSQSKEFARAAVLLQPQNPQFNQRLNSLSGLDKEVQRLPFMKRIHILPKNKAEDRRIAKLRTSYKSGRFKDLIDDGDELLEREPELQNVHGWVGLAYEAMGRIDEAVKRLEMAVAGDPDTAEWWIALAELNNQMGNRKRAYEVLREGAIAIPDSAGIQGALGTLFHADGSITQAIVHLRRSVDLDQNDPAYALLLAKGLGQLGHLEEARMLTRQMINRWDKEPEFAYLHGCFLMEGGDYASALPALATAAASPSPDPDWLRVYAEALYQRVQADDEDHLKQKEPLQKILDLLDRSAEQSDEPWRSSLIRAQVLQRLGDDSAALKAYRLLEDNPAEEPLQDRSAALKGLGEIALKLGEMEPARKALLAVRELEPDNLAVLRQLVEATLGTGQYEEAIETAEKSLDMAGDDVVNLRWFAQVLERAGQTTRAEEAIVAALQLQPDDVDLLLAQAGLQLQNGAGDKSLNKLIHIMDLPADTRQFLEAARLFLSAGEIVKARQAIDLAAEKHDGDDPALTISMAKILDQLGDRKAALAVLRAHPVPRNEEGLMLEADLLTRMGAYDEAKEILAQREFSGTGNSDELLRMQATINYQSGAVMDAWQQMRQLVEGQAPEKEDLILAARIALARMDYTSLDALARKNSEDGAGSGLPAELRLTMAESFLDRGDTARATAMWESVVGDEPQKVWAALIEARLDARSGDWQHAAGLLKEYELSWTLQEAIPYSRAAMEIGEWEEAISALEKYRLEYPRDPRAVSTLLLCLLGEAEWLGDMRLLDSVAHSGSKDACSDAQYIKAKELFHQLSSVIDDQAALSLGDRLDLAFDASHLDRMPAAKKESADLVPSVLRAMRNTGKYSEVIRLAQGNLHHQDVLWQAGLSYLEHAPQTGMDLLEKNRAVETANPRLLALYGLLAEKSGRPDEMIVALTRALEIWADETRWRERVAYAAEQAGNLQTAIEHLQELSRRETEADDYQRALARVHLKAGNQELAETILRELTDKNPDDYELLTEYAQAAKANCNYEAALAAADKAARLSPNDVRNLVLMSSILSVKGDKRLAMNFAQVAVQKSPSHPEALLAYVQALSMNGSLAQAMKEIETYEGKQPLTRELFLEKAMLTYKLYGAETAMPMFDRHCHDYPDDIEAISWLARTQIEQGDRNGAEKSALRALQMNPNQPDLNIMVGRLERQIGNLDKSIEFLNQAIRLESENIEAYLELGLTYQAAHDVQKALACYEQLRTLAPQDPRGFSEAAGLYKDIKEFTRAEEMLQQALRLAPDDDQIRRHLTAVSALNMLQRTQEEQIKA